MSTVTSNVDGFRPSVKVSCRRGLGVKSETMKAGLVAGALLLSLPLCAAEAQTGQRTLQPRNEIRDMRLELAWRNAELAEEARGKSALNKRERQEDGGSPKEHADDAAVTAKIRDAFLGRQALDSLDIKVVTVGGTATLIGNVKNSTQAALAEEVAKQVGGVKAVNNQLVAME